VLGVIERVEVVPYGRPATEALSAVVQAAHATDALAPVTVIVASNLAGLTARRMLGSGTVGPGGIANVAFVTPFRLAELLAADRLLDRRPLTNPVLGAAVRRVLADDPGPFAAVADHYATEAALAALYAELSNVEAATLDRLAREGGATGGRVVRFQRAVRRHLEAFHDEADLARAAAERPDLATALEPYGQLIWHLPTPTTAPMARFVGALAAAAPLTVIVGVTGDDAADEPVWSTLAAAGASGTTDVPVPAPATAARIVSVTDADEEVRAVVRRVVALAEEGVPLERIGVFHPAPDPYVRILEQQLAAANLPANGPSRRRLIDTVAGRTLTAALALPSERWRRDRVLALVNVGPLRHDDSFVRPSVWERVSREAGVVQGLDDWSRKLATHRAGLEHQRQRLDPADSPGWVERLERDLADADALAGFVDDVAGAVVAVERAEGWPAKAEAATALLHLLLGAGHQHASWPEPEQEAFERVEDVLVRLAALGELEPDPSHEVFDRALGAELDVSRGRAGRFGLGVVYGPLSSAIGHDLDAVFIVGCAEAICPAPRRDDALLPDAVRRLAPGELDLRSARLIDQHRDFLAALAAAPPERRTLTFPRGDLRGNRHLLPSRWLLDSASALAGHTVFATDFATQPASVVEVVPSFAAGLDHAGVHADVDERDLAVLRTHEAAGGAAIDHPLGALGGRGLEVQCARRSSDFTEWDGNLIGQSLPSTADQPLSASRLETWAKCGYRYFLHHLLGLAERDDPERVVDLGPLDRGSSVHAALEQFIGEAIDAGPPAPDEPWTDEQHERLREIAASVFVELEARGRTGRPIHWQITRANLLALLDDFLHVDDEFRADARVRPERVELPFGLDGVEPVTIDLPDGRRLAFRGRADRVDRADDGTLVVSDYKTGKGGAYVGIDEGDPVLDGTTLQLGLYAEAAIQHLHAPAAQAYYWMVEPSVAFARSGYPWTPDRRERFVDVLATIVDGIEGGVFPVDPGEWNSWRGTHEACTYCEFDTVCSRDRGEHAEAKIDAPALRVRHALLAEVDE
jgi:hypothetical protein